MTASEPGLVPTAALSPRVERAWYVVARCADVGRAPVLRALWGTPIVLWRAPDGAVHAVLDRCPHRNVPLHDGKVEPEGLRCRYHGWVFGGDGACRHVPALDGASEAPARRVPRWVAREQQGFVWLWGERDGEPVGSPPSFPEVDDPRYLTVIRPLRTRGSVHAVIENALDVPHTGFLHGGWFRKDGDRKPIRCVVERFDDHVQAEYIGESRPKGFVARLLSPSGGEVRHFDRFRMPSMSEVEYAIGTENHLVLRGLCTPVADDETEVWATVSLRSRLPRALVRLVIAPLAAHIFAQDADILAAQDATLKAFGGGKYVSTEIDLLGTQILRMMTRAARGEPAGEGEPYRREITMWV